MRAVQQVTEERSQTGGQRWSRPEPRLHRGGARLAFAKVTKAGVALGPGRP